MHDRPHNLRTRRRRLGMAMILVLCAIGLATVLGAAILATSSTQVQVKANILAAWRAQYLAESGVNLGIYRLQNPQSAPLLNGSGFYPGEVGISLGADVPGTVDLAITNVGTNTYNVASTGHAGPSVGSRAMRSVTAKIYVNTLYEVPNAMACNGAFTMPSFMSVDGNVRCDGNLTLAAGASITGAVGATASNSAAFSAPASFPPTAAPLVSDIDIYNTTGASPAYYVYVDIDGLQKIGYAEELGAAVSGTLLPGPDNPKNVWYSDGFVVLSNFTLNGTLVLRDSTKALTIVDNVQITAMSNMPAMVIAGPIQFAADALPKSLTVEGLCWIGANIATVSNLNASDCTVHITGALMTGPSVTGVSAKVDGLISVTFDASKVQVPNFSRVGATPKSVKILRWGI